MTHFQAERIIYGKLAGADREHTVVAQSLRWPSDGGVPKSVGMPVASPLQGACSLDWHQSATKLMLALSWCEAAPRITSRDFCQTHHMVAQPNALASVLTFLPELVAKLRNIPIFGEIEKGLTPFVFDYPDTPEVTVADEEWFMRHWLALSSVLTDLLKAKSVYIRGCTDVEEKIKIVAALMRMLPRHLRAHLTFSTDEYGRRPYWRRVTFSAHNRSDTVVFWNNDGAAALHPDSRHPLLVEFGRILNAEGLAALLSETSRPEYHLLSFDSPDSASQVRALRLSSSL